MSESEAGDKRANDIGDDGDRGPVFADPGRWSDLRNRTITALIAMFVVGSVIFVGGWWWVTFVVIATIAIFREWGRLVYHRRSTDYLIWIVFGIIYILLGGFLFIELRNRPNGIVTLYAIISGVISTDTLAYFSGRFVGGKKIAPKISPSKTWSGLFGGCIGAAVSTSFIFLYVRENSRFYGILESLNSIGLAQLFLSAFSIGVFLATVAQAGDFFESWMKRSAGVKDSGRLLPGHGGIFDRVDGLLAVTLIAGTAELISGLWR